MVRVFFFLFFLFFFFLTVTEKFQQKHKRINLWTTSTFSVPSKIEQALFPSAFFSDLIAMDSVPAVL